MEDSPLLVEQHSKYCYLEVAQETELDSKILKIMTDVIQKAAVDGKKSIVCLAPNFKISDENFKSFFGFIFAKLLNYVLFVSKEGIRWGNNWKKLANESFWISEKNKAIRWVEQGFKLGKVSATSIGDTIYFKCLGNAKVCIPALDSLLDETLKTFTINQNIMSTPTWYLCQEVGVWSYLSGSIIFDVAELPLELEFCEELVEMLRMQALSPDSPGIFFVTDGQFQTFLLEQRLHCSVRTVSNIIRVLPANTDASDMRATIKQEVFPLLKVCQSIEPLPILMTLQVSGYQDALKAIKIFYPDIIIADELSDANALKDAVYGDIEEKLFNITPASDPSLLLLSPQLISQGYDLKLFAEYLVSRYRNNRGYPNDTYFYYLNADPSYLKKLHAFFLMEFAGILSEDDQHFLEAITSCETQADMQGSAVISILQEKILRLDFSLPFTHQGANQFFMQYDDLFPEHFQKLCGPLRLFLRSDDELYLDATMHIIDEYNDFALRSTGFSIETRLQPGKANLTIKAKPNPLLEKRCKSFFALLNGSEIFESLPDKEILIEIISLMWQNYMNQEQKKGFVINLALSEPCTTLKIFQNDNNKVLLETNAEGLISFQATLPFSMAVTRNILKMISLLFNSDAPEANNWRFACFEAVSKVTENETQQNLQLNFEILGECLKAVFISDAHNFTIIPDSSQQVFSNGAESVHIAENGRQIKLLIHPRPGDDVLEEMPALATMNEDNILQAVEDEKTKEAQERSLRFQNIYEQALNSYNKKYGFDENDILDKSANSPKTLEEALRTRLFHAAEQKAKKKIRRNLYTLLGILVLVSVLGYIIVGYCLDFNQQSNFLLIDSDSSRFILPPPPPETPKVEEPKLPEDPARDLVLEACNMTNTISLSHVELNAMLKKLYKARKLYQNSGDYFNIQGRLYLYKIQLDKKEHFFSKEWIERWQKEAETSLVQAFELYKKNEVQTSFRISYVDWKPEKELFPDVSYVQYKDNKEAENDVQALYAKIRKKQ